MKTSGENRSWHVGIVICLLHSILKFVYRICLFCKISKLKDTFFAILIIRHNVLIFYDDCEFWMPRRVLHAFKTILGMCKKSFKHKSPNSFSCAPNTFNGYLKLSLYSL